MKTIYLTLIPALVLPLLAGCGMSEMAEVSMAFVLEIRDAQTGAPAAYRATAIARSGSYADTAKGPGVNNIILEDSAAVDGTSVGERPGVYELTVTHPGYKTCHRTGIRVPVSDRTSFFDGSHLAQTVFLTVELQPLDESQTGVGAAPPE